MYKTYWSVLVAAGFSSAMSLAADNAEVRQHGAHEHGSAQLNVVLEGSGLALELISPAVNIVGFEHEPGNDEQKKAIDDAIAVLQDAGKIFSFPEAAGCQLANAEVEATMLDDEHHKDEHDEHDDEHKDGHEEHAEDAHEETHSEFHVVYEFNCDDPAQLSHIDVLVFEVFPGTEELDAQIIGPNGQTALELTADSSRLDL